MHKPAELLAVDDNATALEAIRATVEPLGARLTTAASGEEALRCLLHEPDMAAILMDVGLPGMDGFETAAAIRRRQKTRYVPIIFVTGEDAPERTLEAYAAGAVDYIVKPFDPAVLRSKLSVFIDLHQLRRHTAALTHRALHDGLTGLPNRELFEDRLEQALARARRRTVPLAVLFVDLDGFKQVNDVYGHQVGDRLLSVIGAAIRDNTLGHDIAGRLGGDEFGVVLTRIDGHTDAVSAAVTVAERIIAEIDRDIIVDGHVVRIGCSIGIAVADPGMTDAQALTRSADTAMYASKRRQRNGYEVVRAPSYSG